MMPVVSSFGFALVLGLSTINAVAAELVAAPAGYRLEHAVLVIRHDVTEVQTILPKDCAK